MFGAILGDIIGSPYEFDRGSKTKNFPFFDKGCGFTDDTVMTIAVAEGLMKIGADADDDVIKGAITDTMHKWGAKYPNAGYGSNFGTWLHLKDKKPYNSFGNGSAMRVSAAGWLAETLDEARRLARLTAEVTHNHPEGIKGAEATASAIFMARSGCCKEEIKDYIIDKFEYDLSRTCDEIRPAYHHVESCQETVPEAITAFLEGNDFEDVIRTAVSLGGDCDTLTAIAGSIAEAFYGIPFALKIEAYHRLEEDLNAVLAEFELHCHFREDIAQKYHPLYWFDKDEDGYVRLHRPFGEPLSMTRYDEYFHTSEQALDGWRRANLYMESFGVWDATMFAASMNATLVYGPFLSEANGEEYVLAFTTPQTADKSVYPLLTEEEIKGAREGVDLFYDEPQAQMLYHDVILYPVLFMVTKTGEVRHLHLTKAELDFVDFRQPKMLPFEALRDEREREWRQLWERKYVSRDEILASKSVHFYNGDTLFVELDEDEVYELGKGCEEWDKKNNFYDYYDSSLVPSYFKYITKEEAADLAEEWIEMSALSTYERDKRNSERLSKAIAYATEQHGAQYRKGTTLPYIVHPMEVLSILVAMKADNNLMMAGVLHDTLEDTNATKEKLRELFGVEVAWLVGEHTEDKRKTWKERKEAAYRHTCTTTIRVKKLVLADKLSNLRSIHRDYQELGDALWDRFNAGRDKQAWYYGNVIDALVDLQYDEAAARLYRELVALYKDVFVTFYLDRDKCALYQGNGAGKVYKLTKKNPEWVAYHKDVPKGAIVVERMHAEHLEASWADPYGEVLLFDMQDKTYDLYSSTSRSLSLAIEDNTLRFIGEDFGEECLDLHGKEYEFHYTLDEERTYQFLLKLRKKYGAQESLESILKEAFGGDDGSVKFISFCKRNKIEYAQWVF